MSTEALHVVTPSCSSLGKAQAQGTEFESSYIGATFFLHSLLVSNAGYYHLSGHFST